MNPRRSNSGTRKSKQELDLAERAHKTFEKKDNCVSLLTTGSWILNFELLAPDSWILAPELEFYEQSDPRGSPNKGILLYRRVPGDF